MTGVMAVSGSQTIAAGATQEPATMRAAAVVNDVIISTYDLDQRVKLLMITSGAQNPEAAKRLRPQVLRTLIDEMLQMQEAQKYEVKISQEELNKNFQRIASQNQISTEQINKMLDDNGIARSTLQNQMKADIAWQKIVQGKLAPRVTVSDEEVEIAFIAARESSQKTLYMISEIFLPVDSPNDEDQVKQRAQAVIAQLHQGTPFGQLAQQFGRSNGGDLGAVSETELNVSYADKVRKMTPGTISEPIRGSAGYYIVGLREKRLPVGGKVQAAAPPPKPQAAQKMKGQVTLGRVSITMSANASKAKQEQVANAARTIYGTINGCQNAGGIAKANGAKFEMLGALNVRDLAPPFQEILGKTPNGRSTPPLRGAAGIEMFVICSGGMIPAAGAAPEGRQTTTTATEVTKEQIESQLYNQELSMLTRRYMRDLRRDATIEIRDN
jgi:peptidyl-prolyl cis-trans isomerase SurA